MKAPTQFGKCEDYLHDVAHKISGLTNFGENYLTGLRICLASMDADPRFTPAGKELAWDAVVMTLVSRAFAEEGWKRYPEWQGYKPKKPILITGLPRTGTTALHKLLGVDPQFQGVENWLTAAPMPRPPRETWFQDPSYLRAKRWLNQQHAESPGIAVAHDVVAEELDEQLELQRQSFVSNRWACTWYSPGYDAWWTSQDEKPSFLRELKLLQLIGCHDQEKQWLLKNPGSMGMLEWWLEAVPDVLVIQTHRDPVAATASISSTLQHIHMAFEGQQAERSRRLLGPRELEKWAGMLDRGAPFRARHESQFFDVYHAEFHADPLGVAGKIYDFLGLRLTAETESRMAEFVARNAGAVGRHSYNLDSFGLTREMVVERHEKYIERYGLSDPAKGKK